MFSTRDLGIGKLNWAPALPPPKLVFGVGLMLTLIAFALVQQHERGRDHDLFNAEITEFMSGMRQSMSSSEVLMQSGAGVIAAHPNLGAEEWRLFVDTDDLKSRFPGFQGIGYLRDRRGGAQDAASTSSSDLDLALVEPHGTFVASQLAGGRAGDAARARAHQINGPARSRKVMLPSPGHGDRVGVLVYLPVFRRETMADARAKSSVTGYVVMPFAVSTLVQGLMQQRFDKVKHHLRVEIFDGQPEPANLLFDSASELGYAPPTTPRVVATLAVDRFGTDWSYRFSSLPAYDRATRSYVPAFVLAGGLVVTGLVSWLCAQLHARDRRAAEADRASETLRAELMHRVHNTLAVVQSIANRSLVSGESADDGREQFSSRLSALARAHALLTENGWSGTPIGELVRSELAPLMHRAHAHGPDITLGPQVAQALALIVHELATDAVKRGVELIEVQWDSATGPEPSVAVTWKEIGAANARKHGLAEKILAHGLMVVSDEQHAEGRSRLHFSVPLR